jgi:hypothetical protein
MPPAAPPVFILGNKPGKLQIRVSGTKQILDAWIDQDSRVWASMPVPLLFRVEQKGNCSIVPLDGITQVVTSAPNPTLNQEQLKRVGFRLLEMFSLTTSVPAAGVMFVSRKKGVISIDPVVWVRDIKTLFCETACASGSTAVGIAEAINKRRSLDRIPILQPSGENLLVSVRLRRGIPVAAAIGGPISVRRRNIIISILNRGTS